MKPSPWNTAAALLITSGLTAQASHAAGLSVTTSCKSLSPDSRTQLSLTVVRAVDYNARTARLDAEYAGTMQWDAEPHVTQGKFSGALPVSSAPVPNLPNEFSVSDGAESVSELIQKESGTNAPFTAKRLNMKFQVSSGVLGMGAQYAVLKIALPNTSRGTVAAFGNLYITNRSESSVTTPDGGSQVSLVCENQIRDL